MPTKAGKKEFRTSVILTEEQHKRVLAIARLNDASIAWVLRRALDGYLDMNRMQEASGGPVEGDERPNKRRRKGLGQDKENAGEAQ